MNTYTFYSLDFTYADLIVPSQNIIHELVSSLEQKRNYYTRVNESLDSINLICVDDILEYLGYAIKSFKDQIKDSPNVDYNKLEELEKQYSELVDKNKKIGETFKTLQEEINDTSNILHNYAKQIKNNAHLYEELRNKINVEFEKKDNSFYRIFRFLSFQRYNPVL